jgi:hypothetical protein
MKSIGNGVRKRNLRCKPNQCDADKEPIDERLGFQPPSVSPPPFNGAKFVSPSSIFYDLPRKGFNAEATMFVNRGVFRERLSEFYAKRARFVQWGSSNNMRRSSGSQSARQKVVEKGMLT